MLMYMYKQPLTNVHVYYNNYTAITMNRIIQNNKKYEFMCTCIQTAYTLHCSLFISLSTLSLSPFFCDGILDRLIDTVSIDLSCDTEARL